MLYEKLDPYQVDAVKFALDIKTAALFFDQGTGKTWIAGGIIEQLCLTRPKLNGLVVVPLSNLETTWADLLSQVNVNIYRDWEEYKRGATPRLLLIHYEGLPKIDKRIAKHPWTFVTFDESQRIKARNSRQSRIAARKGLREAEYKLILTGTPFDDLLDDPQQLWSQFRFLRPQLFGTRWGVFDQGYLYRTGWMGKKRKFRKGMFPRFLREIEPYVYRVTKDQVLDLPPLSFEMVPVELFGKQRRMYEELERNAVIQVAGRSLVTDLKIVQDGKLHQITSGFIIESVIEAGKRQKQRVIHQVGNAKLRKLRWLIRRLDLPIVIFCRYREEVRQIEQLITESNTRVATITGETRKTRAQTIRAFSGGKIDVLIAQVRTGGIGIDLDRSHSAIFYSTTWSFIDFDQAVSRLHRRGQTEPVKIFLLYAKRTIDKVVYESILLKRDTFQMVWEHLRKETLRWQRRPRTKQRPRRQAELRNLSTESPTLPLHSILNRHRRG